MSRAPAGPNRRNRLAVTALTGLVSDGRAPIRRMTPAPNKGRGSLFWNQTGGGASPQLVTFNGNSFDLPVLRYRAMVQGVSAPGLSARPYFHRYTEDAIDLCDVLSSFSSQSKATLHEISRVMGLSGKPKGIDGGEVERYFHEGKIREIADYCETDVVGTYQVWLRYELFRGTLSQGAFETSQRNLADFMNARFRQQGPQPFPTGNVLT